MKKSSGYTILFIITALIGFALMVYGIMLLYGFHIFKMFIPFCGTVIFWVITSEIYKKAKTQGEYEDLRREENAQGQQMLKMEEIYLAHLSKAKETLEIKLQKTNTPDRQENILETLLFSTLELHESINDDSFVVSSDVGTVGEISTSDSRKIANLGNYTAYFITLLNADNVYGMKIKAIR